MILPRIFFQTQGLLSRGKEKDTNFSERVSGITCPYPSVGDGPNIPVPYPSVDPDGRSKLLVSSAFWLCVSLFSFTTRIHSSTHPRDDGPPCLLESDCQSSKRTIVLISDYNIPQPDVKNECSNFLINNPQKVCTICGLLRSDIGSGSV